MSIQDRDYYRDPPTTEAPPPDASPTRLRPWSITMWLIAINVAVLAIDTLLIRAGHAYRFGFNVEMGPLEYWGHFSADTAIQHGQAWRLITFQFLHANLTHLMFNMIALYFFGPLIEFYLGSRRFTAFYLLSGVGGAACYLAMWGSGVVVSAPWVPLVGASAGIFGILIAAACVAPNATVMLLFPPIPMKLKTFAWVLIGISVYTVFFHGGSRNANAGGEAGHLGGAIVGYLLIKNPRLLSFLKPRPKSLDEW